MTLPPNTRLNAIADSLAHLSPITLRDIAAVDPITAQFLAHELGPGITDDTVIDTTPL